VSHRYVVHISDTGLLAPTRARSATDLGSDGRVIPPSPTSPGGGGLGPDGRGSPTTGTRRSTHQYRFDCELGDVWTELTSSTSSGAALALATTYRVPRRTANMSMTSPTTTNNSSVHTDCAYCSSRWSISLSFYLLLNTAHIQGWAARKTFNRVRYFRTKHFAQSVSHLEYEAKYAIETH